MVAMAEKREKKKKICILQVNEGFSAALGGTALAVGQMANYLAEKGIQVSLWGLAAGVEKERVDSLDPSIQVMIHKTSWGRRLGYSGELRRLLPGIKSPHLVHIHGLWRLHYAQVSRYARQHRIPVVLSPHGMLDAWELHHKKRVKQLTRILYQDRILDTAACLHATSQKETDTLRHLGFRRPIALIPWGVEFPDHRPKERRGAGGSRWPIPEGARVALFLSRLHPKKGLDLLLRAWSRVHPQFPSWVLVIAGYDEGGYGSQMTKLVEELGIGKSVFFAGPVQGEEKERAYADAELFILPSRSENFGLVVAEALARGIPVITTEGTPWAQVAEWGCGWWVEVGMKPLAAALAEALGKSPDELQVMGKIGRDYAERRLRSEDSGRAMLDLYGWLLGWNPQPSFVQGG